MIDYEQDTLNAYRTPERAANYKRFHTADWTWGRFVTCLEQRAIARELARYNWSPSDQLLDIPCGTGVLGKLLHQFPFRIVASDISAEMMAIARTEYPVSKLVSCIQADVTNTPFLRRSFECVITIGFLHRVPWEIKRNTLREIAELSNRVAIISCSVDTPLQRLKQAFLSRVKRNHLAAPCPVPIRDIIVECETNGFRVIRAFMVLPFFSAHAVLVLEK
ncbi:MAG: class I SAM-dependent methyltransferase [Desulfobacterales bacterium]|nr:class I SAM-dependent methyltransferase [Desulfobacterales bacterium]